MATDSTVAGYLVPTASPFTQMELEQAFHDFIVGVTGIRGDHVRPRWVPEPTQQPGFDVNWVAFGVIEKQPDQYPYQEQTDTEMKVDGGVTLNCLLSFYGPDSTALEAQLRASINITQNRAALYAQGILFQGLQDPVVVPVQVKEKWLNRMDVNVMFTHRAVHTYPIRTIESAQLGLDNEHYVTPIQTPTT